MSVEFLRFQRCPLEHVVLNAKLLDMGEPKALLSLAISAPDESGIEYAVLLLKEVNYIQYMCKQSVRQIRLLEI